MNGRILETGVIADGKAVVDALEVKDALALERPRAGEAADVVVFIARGSMQDKWQNHERKSQLHFGGLRQKEER